MRGTTLPKGTYSCPAASDGFGTCRYNMITRQGLEAFVVAWVLERFSPEAIAAGEHERRKGDVSARRAKTLRTQISAVNHALDVLEEDRASGIYDDPSARNRSRQQYRLTTQELGRLEHELVAIEVRHARATPSAAKPITQAEWAALSINQKRTTVREVVDQITIGPSSRGRQSGPKFDSGRVTIVPVTD